MADSRIGIRVADGSFFPILDEQQRGARKRLVLTTVSENQDSVQIDLYRGQGDELSSAEYVGSLVIQSISQAGAGEPEIQLILGLDSQGNLNATANDAASGEYQSLSVSLESLSEEDTYSIPDFELDTDADLDDLEYGDSGPDTFDDEGVPPEALVDNEFADSGFGDVSTGIGEGEIENDLRIPGYDPEPGEFSEADEPDESYVATPITANPLLFVGFLVLSLAALAILTYLIFDLLKGPAQPPLEAGLHIVQRVVAFIGAAFRGMA